jgi:hypothetical protein
MSGGDHFALSAIAVITAATPQVLTKAEDNPPSSWVGSQFVFSLLLSTGDGNA